MTAMRQNKPFLRAFRRREALPAVVYADELIVDSTTSAAGWTSAAEPIAIGGF